MSESKLLMSRKQLAVMCHDDPDAIRLMERLAKVSAAFEGYLPDNLPYVTDADLESNVPELGSNSNGYWAKFPSGLLIQWTGNWKTMTGTGNNASRTYSWTFPTPFLDTEYYMNAYFAESTNGIGSWNSAQNYGTSNEYGAVAFYASGPGTSYCRLFAIGRWK